MSIGEESNLSRLSVSFADRGIGMALVQRIVTMHKASIEVDSKVGHCTCLGNLYIFENRTVSENLQLI